MRRILRLLGGPLALLWLALSNSALCVALPMPAPPHAHDAHAHHAAHPSPGHEAGQHEHAANHAAPGSGHDCCAAKAAYPCCSGAAYAPAFDSPAMAKLLAVALPVEPWPALLRLPARSEPPLPRVRPPAQAGPPAWLRCCSLLI